MGTNVIKLSRVDDNARRRPMRRSVLTAVSRPFDVHLTSTVMKVIYFNTFDKCKR